MKVFILAWVILASMLDLAHGGITKTRTPTAWRQRVVDAHNELRTNFDAPEMKMGSPEMCKFSQNWANKLAVTGKFEHSTDGKYGENIARSSEQSQPNAKETVASFFGEIKDYNFNTNNGNGGVVGHFTQVVWKGSTSVCASYAIGPTGAYSVFNYEPPGNFLGQNAANVKIKQGVTLVNINAHLQRFSDNASKDAVIPPDPEKASDPDYDDGKSTGAKEIVSLSGSMMIILCMAALVLC